FLFSLPQPITLIIIFSILSAAFSSCDAYLLASGIIFSKDIVSNIFVINNSQKGLITATRIGIILSGVLGCYASTKIYDVFELYMLGAYIGGSVLTVPYLLTWFSKKMNGAGIIGGMIGSVAVFMFSIRVLNYSQTMLVSMVANFIIAHIVCRFFKAPSEEAIGEVYYFSKKFEKTKNIPE
ncbi:MAG: hypothetical protein AAGU75_08475, partial [Bacillota bacterium]